jgi:hypothetical protein
MHIINHHLLKNIPFTINDNGLNQKEWPWLQDQSLVSFRVKKNKTLLLYFQVPFDKLKAMHPELLSFSITIFNQEIQVGGFTVTQNQNYCLALDSKHLSLQKGSAILKCVASTFFVPSQINDGPDTRKLSCVLKHIRYI